MPPIYNDDEPKETSFKYNYGEFKSEFDNLHKYACTDERYYQKTL